ncbi:MAG: AzlC family ABC transporter permease [Hyphomicrobiales bacterium]|nr:AzlC family ABC transporter permease [Hyphomicrobiales bacterium]
MDMEGQVAGQARGRLAWWREGARQAIIGPAWVVAFSLFGIGGLARAAHYPLGVAIAATVGIWAGPAQAIFFVASAAKTAWPVIALSASLSSMRMLPMTIALLPLLRSPKTRLTSMVAASWFMGITVWTESLRRTPALPREVRLPFYFGFAMTCMGVATCTTVLGYEIVSRVPLPLAAALLFLSPLYFVVALSRNARVAADWLAIVLGMALAPLAMAYVGGGFDLFVLGLVAGGVAWFWGYRTRKRLAGP